MWTRILGYFGLGRDARSQRPRRAWVEMLRAVVVGAGVLATIALDEEWWIELPLVLVVAAVLLGLLTALERRLHGNDSR